MKNYFCNSKVFDSDCFVADYTNISENRRGVEISDAPFQDIAFFHLKVARKGIVKYLAVNLEKYPAFVKDIDNCECVFSALAECRKPWLLFLETKYCLPDNIEGYTFKAFNQMNETLGRLIDEKLVRKEDRNVYFTYSVPEHTDRLPFGAFSISQNDTLKELEKSGIHLIGENILLIATASHILVPKRNVI